jgi:hypothetical protein
VAIFARSRFVPTRGGEFKLRLDDDERALLATLPDQMEALLTTGGPGSGEAGLGMVRLFPPAYLEEEQLDAEYHRLMRDELVRRRLDAVATLRDTIGADHLTAEQLHTWARVLNDVRLVLGTLLDVSEDTDVLAVDPESDDATQRVVYVVLSSIVDEAVEALSAGLPPASA